MASGEVRLVQEKLVYGGQLVCRWSVVGGPDLN
jgi:hypothetical protein